ncbi:secreted protein, partial [gut metagenome]
MKSLFLSILLAFVFSGISFASDFANYRGVWASNDAEAVVTDSVCIFFEKTPT